jgi:hypothetical protein
MYFAEASGGVDKSIGPFDRLRAGSSARKNVGLSMTR